MAEKDNYHRQRIEEELAAAERAQDPAIARIHLEMAQRYRDKIDLESPLETNAAAPSLSVVL